METKLLTAERFVDNQTGISYRYVYSDTEYFRPHYHDYFEIFLTLKGSALHLVGDRQIRLEEHTLVLIRPLDRHDYRCENGDFSMLNIAFTEQTARELFQYLGEGFSGRELLHSPLPPQKTLSKPEMDEIRAQMDAVRALKPEEYDKRRTALRLLLLHLVTEHFAMAQVGEQDKPAWLEQLCARLRAGDFCRNSAYIFGLTDKTREHVSRCMKRCTGMTVSEYVNDLRVNYIANMLRNSNHSVTHIIFESGFNNISWASEQFKKRFGMSMREYRNRG